MDVHPEKPKKSNNRIAARKARAEAGLTSRVLHIRIKDKHAKFLSKKACDVNMVWNFDNELGFKKLQREGKFISSEELHVYTKGASRAGLDLHSQTIQAVNEEFVTRRKQFKKPKLRWRVSSGPKRSLGWIPFKQSAVNYKNGQIHFGGVALSLWDSFGLSDYKLRAGSICEDARGRWYINLTVQVKQKDKPSQNLSQVSSQAIGIDLGLKDLMTASDGSKVPAQRFYRDLEPKLAVAQRANKAHRVRAIHAKIANIRKDHLHKLSTAQVKAHQAIFVGNVDAQKLTQTKMAKSVLDAGWSTYRTMLKYKCDDAGVWFSEINEAYSTQECSGCSSIEGPKGLEGLGVRTWTCSVCGAGHDRDTNSAQVIKGRGLAWLDKEFSAADSRLNEIAAKANEVLMATPSELRPGMGVQ